VIWTLLVPEKSLQKFMIHSSSFLLNRIAGYCLPHNVLDDTTPYPLASTSGKNEIATNLDQPALKPRSSLLMEKQQTTETNMENLLATTRKFWYLSWWQVDEFRGWQA